MDIDPFEEPIDNDRYLALARKYAGGARTHIDESSDLKPTFRPGASSVAEEQERLLDLVGKVEMAFVNTERSRRRCLETLDCFEEAFDDLRDLCRTHKDVKDIEKHLSWMRDVRRYVNTDDKYHPQAKAIVNGTIDEQEEYWNRVRAVYERTGLMITSPFLLRVVRLTRRIR